MDKPFSEACERNKQPICEVLQQITLPTDRVLFEVGSGTGQHAIHCAKFLPHITWMTSDVLDKHEGIKKWLAAYEPKNVQAPIEFEVGSSSWPKVDKIDVVFTANTFQIMSWDHVVMLIDMVGDALEQGARFCVYGPFCFDGTFTAPSNLDFDQKLRAQDPAMGIRDVTEIRKRAATKSLTLMQLMEMPANNHILLFQKM